jgi:hypothetical protein
VVLVGGGGVEGAAQSEETVSLISGGGAVDYSEVEDEDELDSEGGFGRERRVQNAIQEMEDELALDKI